MQSLVLRVGDATSECDSVRNTLSDIQRKYDELQKRVGLQRCGWEARWIIDKAEGATGSRGNETKSIRSLLQHEGCHEELDFWTLLPFINAPKSFNGANIHDVGSPNRPISREDHAFSHFGSFRGTSVAGSGSFKSWVFYPVLASTCTPSHTPW
jgi:hypothetical protein